MNCSDCSESYKEQKREAPCDSCPIGWFMREAEAMKKPTIKECFYLSKAGRCCSPEIYRKIEGMDTGKLCPFNLDDLVFRTHNPNEPTCLEFTPKRIDS
jgi:hypothetical protein